MFNNVLFISVFALLFMGCTAQQSKLTPELIPNNSEVIYNNIMTRSSVRVYLPEQIRKTALDSIIQCGIHAPSALNLQKWELRVVQNADLLQQINVGFVDFIKDKEKSGSALKSQQAGFSVFHGAPTVIFIASEKGPNYSKVDCGLLGQNILLSAHAMGIGSCVVGSVASYLNSPEGLEKFVPKLDLPDDYEVLYAIVLGYPNEKPAAKPRDIAKVKFIE